MEYTQQTVKEYEHDSKLDRAHQKLQSLHKMIRHLSPKWPATLRITRLEYLEWMKGKPARRCVIISPIIHGCQYRQETGGCFPCGEFYGLGKTPGLAISVKPILDEVLKWHQNIKKPPEWCCWYIEGSNLNKGECPKEALRIILTLIAETPSIQRITIESRPEYVSDDALDLLEEISTKYNIEVEIGMGVEVYDDFIRRYCFNKGETFTWELFKSTVRRIKERRGLRVLSYIILKPPFLTEKEGIEEAVKTIEESFKVGVDAISLEIMSIHEFTLVEYLWLRRLYRPPWLWSALEVVERTYNKGEIRIGGEPKTYYPASRRAAYNDGKCTARVWKAIRQYNETHDINFLKGLACDCKERWNKVINNIKPHPNLIERIVKVANNLSLDDYISRKLYSSMEGD
jgi:radical SAM enzyme (TIGR01210 family)